MAIEMLRVIADIRAHNITCRWVVTRHMFVDAKIGALLSSRRSRSRALWGCFVLAENDVVHQ